MVTSGVRYSIVMGPGVWEWMVAYAEHTLRHPHPVRFQIDSWPIDGFGRKTIDVAILGQKRGPSLNRCWDFTGYLMSDNREVFGVYDVMQQGWIEVTDTLAIAPVQEGEIVDAIFVPDKS